MSRVSDAMDAVLEASVAGSFTRVGPFVRRRLEGWTQPAPGCLAGRTIAVTGATSGLGLATARRVASLSGRVLVLARDAARGEAVCARLAEESRTTGHALVLLDVGELADVRRAAAEILARFPRLDALVHNAGSLDDARATTEDGIERTIATHVLGPFLLTDLLRPALRRAAPSRVLFVASGGMYAEPLDVDALEMGEAAYDGVVAYARAKRAQVTLTVELAERLHAEGIVVHAMHPGWADTPGVARSLPRFRALTAPLLRSPEEGIETLVWLLADDGPPLHERGLFWLDRRARSLHKLAKTRRSDTPEERRRLFTWALARSGARFA